MPHSRQLLIAASAGAVVGFTLVMLVMVDSALTWAPLVTAPAIAPNWRAMVTVTQNRDELQTFLHDFGFRDAPTGGELVKLVHRPARLTRAQRRDVDAWLTEVFSEAA